MFCTSCGAALAAGSKFCGSCGAAVESGEVYKADPTHTPESTSTTSPPVQDTLEMPRRSASQSVDRSNTPRPWLRYWAKMLDVWLCAFVLAFFLGVMFPQWIAETNESVLGLILLACAIPIQAMILAVFGNTIGKALLGIKVTHKGEKLTFGQAFTREATVYVKGLGLGIPIVALFTQINAYNHLKNEGASSWDKSEGHLVTHRNPSTAGVIGTITILTIMILISIYGTMDSQTY